jgi:hypothetical protein
MPIPQRFGSRQACCGRSDRRAAASVSDQKSTVNDHFDPGKFRERREQ